MGRLILMLALFSAMAFVAAYLLDCFHIDNIGWRAVGFGLEGGIAGYLAFRLGLLPVKRADRG